MERTRGEILVVSQGLKLAEPLRLQLAAEGWGVRQLRQFVSPSDQADGKRTALVVLDLQPPMPGGLKTCQELRASSSVPLIALLPWADPDPGPRFSGKVIAIAPAATVQSGVSTYLVSMGVGEMIRQQAGTSGSGTGTGTPRAGMSPQRPGVAPGSGTPPDVSTLKPGMTATASIVYSQKADVLTVPNRAIKIQGQNRVVEVMVNGVVETRVVKVGLSSDQVTEITEGLSEGDQVVVQTTGTAAASVPGLTGSGTGLPGSGPGGGGQGGGLPR